MAKRRLIPLYQTFFYWLIGGSILATLTAILFPNNPLGIVLGIKSILAWGAVAGAISIVNEIIEDASKKRWIN